MSRCEYRLERTKRDQAVSRRIDFIETAETHPVPPNAVTQGRTETILGRWLGRLREFDVDTLSAIAAIRQRFPDPVG